MCFLLRPVDQLLLLLCFLSALCFCCAGGRVSFVGGTDRHVRSYRSCSGVRTVHRSRQVTVRYRTYVSTVRRLRASSPLVCHAPVTYGQVRWYVQYTTYCTYVLNSSKRITALLMTNFCPFALSTSRRKHKRCLCAVHEQQATKPAKAVVVFVRE